MSFAFMPLYTGDYHRDTRHLTPEEHGCYLLLLMYCWDQKGPVPLDERRQCGIVNARSGGEIESLRRVLVEYFVRMDDGFYNLRMSEEIARAEKISEHRRAGGLEKARRMRDLVRAASHDAQAVHERSMSRTQAVHERVPPPPPPPSQQLKAKNKASPSAPHGVDQQVWEDWVALRKAKRAAVTPTAIDGMRREAEKAGLSLDAAFRVCCQRGWAGFKADWVRDHRGKPSEAELDALIESLERK